MAEERVRRPIPPLEVKLMPRPRSIQIRSAPAPAPAPKPKPWVPKAQRQAESTAKKLAKKAAKEEAKRKAKEEEERKAREEFLRQEKTRKLQRMKSRRLEKMRSRIEINASKELASRRNLAAQEHQQATKKLEQAKDKAMDARFEKWKQQQQYKQKRTSTSTSVQRVPKLSALFARAGGAEAQEFEEQITAARLATWNQQAGDRWQIVRHHFDGSSIAEKIETEVINDVPLMEGLETFRKDPEKYLAFYFSPKQPTKLTFVLRPGTIRYQPQNLRSDGVGSFLILRHLYKRLEPFPDDLLPAEGKDKHTDKLTFRGTKLLQHKPLLPGRGMGLGDEANMQFMGDLGPLPDHVRQGASIGDCWLLSAIACLADFPWAIERLFRNHIDRAITELPEDAPNQYTVMLWDLKTWKQVPVTVDERLPVQPNEPSYLLGAKPSRDGKYWVPYLEKAIAVHCGGYDKICGGSCTDAWPMLTGSRNQFVVSKNAKTGKYSCNAKYNTNTQLWIEHTNSPKDSKQVLWQVEWPKAGGGGDRTLTLNQNELYERIVAWDENNYLIGAATAGTSDKSTTDGLVDNHAYSVIDTQPNVCKTGIDLLLIRNPWGEGGDLKSGQFMRTSSGWSKYPNIKKELQPTMEDNGLCWVTKSEFFQYFPTVYVCAMDMTRLKDRNYVNDLADHFDKSKTKAKAATKPKEDLVRPIPVDKTTDPNSEYQVVEETFGGGLKFYSLNKQQVKGKSIAAGVKAFKSNPKKYLAIHYQTNMVDENWPVDKQQYTFILRQGTKGLETDKSRKGRRTILMNVPK